MTSPHAPTGTAERRRIAENDARKAHFRRAFGRSIETGLAVVGAIIVGAGGVASLPDSIIVGALVACVLCRNIGGGLAE